jgi:hypothetical protein
MANDRSLPVTNFGMGLAPPQMNSARIAPRAPRAELEDEEVRRERARQNILNDPIVRWFEEYMREYNNAPAPYCNPNLKGPLPGSKSGDAKPYEDPWTGPSLAPKKR